MATTAAPYFFTIALPFTDDMQCDTLSCASLIEQKIKYERMLNQFDAWIVCHSIDKCARNLCTSGITTSMSNAIPMVAAFAREVEAEFSLLVTRERHAVSDQPFDG